MLAESAEGLVPLFLYVHIPYCERRCSYCDFTVFEKHKAPLPPEEYISLLKREISGKARFFQSASVQTVYFGGGTPGALPPEDLGEVLGEIKNQFSVSPKAEITLELNPGNLSPKILKRLQSFGFNRFSLGAQTFDSRFLKKSRRTHSPKDTLRDLALLRAGGVNYSLDLMFGLPGQTLPGLKKDLETALSFSPPHISLYNLTTPKGHELSAGRPVEACQAEMFLLLDRALEKGGLKRYELSNFAKKGFHSRHNSAYWNGSSFLGFGVSAHSYLSPRIPLSGFSEKRPFGCRFWNSKSPAGYARQAQAPCVRSPADNLPSKQMENLKLHEALTDFCHTRLRTTKGLSLQELSKNFPNRIFGLVQEKLQHLLRAGRLRQKAGRFSLTPSGRVLSNQVFLQLTFLRSETAAP